MRNWKRFGIGSLFLFLLAGCSPDVVEISDVALVMITGIDYEEEEDRFIFSVYSIHASAMNKKEKATEWVTSESGKSIMEAAQKLHSRAGQNLTWNHNKFFIVGETAARLKLYEIADMLTRYSKSRMSSHFIVCEGQASDKIKLHSETGDLVSAELIGKVHNEQLTGKSLSLRLKDVVNYATDPYRGFVTSKLIESKPINSSRTILNLSGGAVFNQGKLAGWAEGKEVRSARILSTKSMWERLEFVEVFPFRHTDITLNLKVKDRKIRAIGKPGLEVRILLQGTLISTSKPMKHIDTPLLAQMEKAAGKRVQEMLSGSLDRFQRELRVDVVGFSDYYRRYHPREWNRMKNEWTALYPVLPIQVHVDVDISSIGMSEVLKGGA
jgi:spore germination protein KC